MTRSEFVKRWKRMPHSKRNCFYCGRVFVRGAGSRHELGRETVEHLVPQHSYRGGPPLNNNTVGACAGCNNGKNGSSLREFRTWRGAPFFSEVLLGMVYPVDDNSVLGDGIMRLYYGGMVETWYKQQLNLIDARFNGRSLKQRLHRIVLEAQRKR